MQGSAASGQQIWQGGVMHCLAVMITREGDGGQRQNAKRKRRKRKWMPEAEAEAEACCEAAEVTSARSFAWPECLRMGCNGPTLSGNNDNAQ